MVGDRGARGKLSFFWEFYPEGKAGLVTCKTLTTERTENTEGASDERRMRVNFTAKDAKLQREGVADWL